MPAAAGFLGVAVPVLSLTGAVYWISSEQERSAEQVAHVQEVRLGPPSFLPLGYVKSNIAKKSPAEAGPSVLYQSGGEN